MFCAVRLSLDSALADLEAVRRAELLRIELRKIAPSSAGGRVVETAPRPGFGRSRAKPDGHCSGGRVGAGRLARAAYELRTDRLLVPSAAKSEAANLIVLVKQVIERGETDRLWRMIYELESGQPD